MALIFKLPLLLDAPLLRPDPKRIARMAATLRQLDVLGAEQDAIRALIHHGGFSATEISLMAGAALVKARQLAAEARAH